MGNEFPLRGSLNRCRSCDVAGARQEQIAAEIRVSKKDMLCVRDYSMSVPLLL